jgi:hypothetical protein
MTYEAAFAAEYQNEPLAETADDGGDLLSVDAIAGKTNGFKRGRVPSGVTHLTMFVDVPGDPALLDGLRLAGGFYGVRVRGTCWTTARTPTPSGPSSPCGT